MEFLTLQHYKEPLLAIEKGKGFGYYGALSVTTDGAKVQCHVCGNLFQHLSMHIYNKHNNMRAREYRERFQLAYQTALVSEKQRIALKTRSLEHWRNMTVDERLEYQRKRMEGLMRGKKRDHSKQPKLTLESKNKRGVCPDQLLAKIQEVAKKLGRTPSLSEFVSETGGQRYKHLIYTTFGSWLGALKQLKLNPVQRNTQTTHHMYSDEELLEYLLNFAREHKKVPTYTDFKRNLLPSYDSYIRRFGNINRARELAGVYDFVSEESIGRWPKSVSK